MAVKKQYICKILLNIALSTIDDVLECLSVEVLQH